jgi:hypothetical protein
MLSDIKEPLDDILPGFHNIKFRFDQWDQAIENDKAGRVKQLQTEISRIEKYRKEMLDFYSKIELVSFLHGLLTMIQKSVIFSLINRETYCV